MEAASRLKREFGFPIVYDCHDLLGGFKSVSRDIIAAEQDALDAADLICFSSEWLLEETRRERPGLRARSIVVRNGAELRERPPCSRPARARRVAGYAGSLDFWFDIEAVGQAAERRPEWDFALIGRVESARIRMLERLPNVKLIGEVPYADLPCRMAAFDAALIPFLRLPLTLAANPVKLYEYFSFGLPVVSTRLPETQSFGDLAYLYDSPGEFSEQLDRAMDERDPVLAARREEVARENTWLARCRQLMRCFAALQ
jgi:glycosyltransferase involved in cell wall biosynthesis